MSDYSVFSLTTTTAKALHWHWWNPCIETISTSYMCTKAAAPIANVGKKAIITLAALVTLATTAVFDLISLPYHYYQSTIIKNPLYWNQLLLSSVQQEQVLPSDPHVQYTFLNSIDTAAAAQVSKLTQTKQDALKQEIATSIQRHWKEFLTSIDDKAFATTLRTHWEDYVKDYNPHITPYSKQLKTELLASIGATLAPRQYLSSSKLPQKQQWITHILNQCVQDLLKSYIQTIVIEYARSQDAYGPIARAYVEHLLYTANQKQEKLIFLARDASSLYGIAKRLMKTEAYKNKYPNLSTADKIQLAYFSRAVVKEANCSSNQKTLFQRYVSNQLGICQGDVLRLVDVGFFGSMIKNINKLISHTTTTFTFLVSVSEQAEGFAGTLHSPLKSIKPIGGNPKLAAGSNPAAQWLEDFHQGIRKGAKNLVEQNKCVYPNTLVPDQKAYAAPKYSLEYLIRKFCKKAIVDTADQPALEGDPFDASTNLGKARTHFDEVLMKIFKKQIPLLILHE